MCPNRVEICCILSYNPSVYIQECLVYLMKDGKSVTAVNECIKTTSSQLLFLTNNIHTAYYGFLKLWLFRKLIYGYFIWFLQEFSRLYIGLCNILFKKTIWPGVVVHSCNSSSWKAEAGESPWVWGQPWLDSEFNPVWST